MAVCVRMVSKELAPTSSHAYQLKSMKKSKGRPNPSMATEERSARLRV